MAMADSRRLRFRLVLVLMPLLAGVTVTWPIPAQQPNEAKKAEPRFIDLSLLVAPEYPCTWPTWPKFQINHYQRIGPLGPYNSDVLVIDGNTGTQLDVPPHSVAPPDSRLPTAGPFGRAYTDKVPAWQLV